MSPIARDKSERATHIDVAHRHIFVPARLVVLVLCPVLDVDGAALRTRPTRERTPLLRRFAMVDG